MIYNFLVRTKWGNSYAIADLKGFMSGTLDNWVIIYPGEGCFELVGSCKKEPAGTAEPKGANIFFVD